MGWVIVAFGGVLKVSYTAKSRADSRFWTMSVSSCGMVDGESWRLELCELMEVVSLIQRDLMGWMSVNKLKGNEWLYMKINQLLEWLGWKYDLKIDQIEVNSRWWWRIEEVSQLVTLIPFVLEVKDEANRMEIDCKLTAFKELFFCLVYSPKYCCW